MCGEKYIITIVCYKYCFYERLKYVFFFKNWFIHNSAPSRLSIVENVWTGYILGEFSNNF